MGQHHQPDDFHDEDLSRYNDEDEDLESFQAWLQSLKR